MKKILLSSILVFTSAIAAMASGHTVGISSQNNVACTGSNTGSVTVTVSGGVGPFTYSWIPGGQATASISDLTAGSYTVTVTDQNDLSTATTLVTITQPVKQLSVVSSSTTICSGQCGNLTTTATGGTPVYAYTWAPLVSTWNGLQDCPATTTTYTVTIQDNNGCTATATGTISVNPPLTGITVSDSVYKETCLETGDGAIDITLSGSNSGPFTYQWNNGATTQDITNLVSNTYSVTIFDPSMNCLTKTYLLNTDGSNCGSLSGNVFNDKNTDCTNNAGDLNIPGMMIIANPGNHKAFTNYQGDYVFNSIAYGSYTLTQQITNPYIYPSCSTSLPANLNAGNKNIVNLNFADTANSYLKDVEVYAAGSGGIVPGFLCEVIFCIRDLTDISASGTFCVVLPTGYGSLVTSGIPSGYNITGDTICWAYSNLFGSIYKVFFNVPVNTPLGSIFKACATATVIGVDANLSNNYYCYQRIVTGSFDPNDKSVNPIGQGSQGDITLNDNTLNYHINFQNTGNGPAVNIIVKDTLSDKLDISTFEMTGTSHNYIVDVIEGNILRWKFNNIMLVDSGSNEPASHGWITYKIKQKSSNQIGDQIKNTAHIYFDFNDAVVTNTTLNTIVTPTTIEEMTSTGTSIIVYPNPNNGTMELKYELSNHQKAEFIVYDVTGRKVANHLLEEGKNTLQINETDLQNGIYYYSVIVDGKVAKSDKLIIIK